MGEQCPNKLHEANDIKRWLGTGRRALGPVLTICDSRGEARLCHSLRNKSCLVQKRAFYSYGSTTPHSCSVLIILFTRLKLSHWLLTRNEEDGNSFLAPNWTKACESYMAHYASVLPNVKQFIFGDIFRGFGSVAVIYHSDGISCCRGGKRAWCCGRVGPLMAWRVSKAKGEGSGQEGTAPLTAITVANIAAHCSGCPNSWLVGQRHYKGQAGDMHCNSLGMAC